MVYLHPPISSTQSHRNIWKAPRLFVHPLPGLVPGLWLYRPPSLGRGLAQIWDTPISCPSHYGFISQRPILCLRFRLSISPMYTSSRNSTGLPAQPRPLHHCALCSHFWSPFSFSGDFLLYTLDLLFSKLVHRYRKCRRHCLDFTHSRHFLQTSSSPPTSCRPYWLPNGPKCQLLCSHSSLPISLSTKADPYSVCDCPSLFPVHSAKYLGSFITSTCQLSLLPGFICL